MSHFHFPTAVSFTPESYPPAPPLYGVPRYVAPASTQDWNSVFAPNHNYNLFFIHHIYRALSMATGEELRLSGNVPYNSLLGDHQRLLKVVTDIQASYMALVDEVRQAFQYAAADFARVATLHPPFPGPTWVGHPYTSPPVINAYVQGMPLSLAWQYPPPPTYAPFVPTRPVSPVSPPPRPCAFPNNSTADGGWIKPTGN
ncbi:hypothetical protein C8R46DRAFT_1229446 [Mycena filopes]|nr:hypothetical protein C8R46DRAFT_1229446 [Mycena filopes]